MVLLRGESPLTSCLLDSLLEAVCSREAGLQLQACGLLREFLSWSVRQGGGGGHTKSVLRRLDFLWRHPEASRRLGGCRAFSCLYTVLREERELVSTHLLELVAGLLACVGLGEEGGHQELGEESTLALSRLQRILLHHKTLFLQEAVGRRVPRELEGGTLLHLQLWLLQLASSPHTQRRHRAMELLHPLLRVQPLGRTELEGRKELLGRLLATELGDLGSLGVIEAGAWCGKLQGLLECWALLLGEGLLPPAVLLREGDGLSTLITALLERVAAVEELGPALPSEVASYHRAKCTTVVRLLTLLAALLDSKHPGLLALVRNLPQDLLASCVLLTLLEPSQSGFRLRTKVDQDELASCCSTFLLAVRKNLPHLQEQLQERLTKNYTDSDYFSVATLAREGRSTTGEEVLRGLLTLQRAGLLRVDYDAEDVWRSLVAAGNQPTTSSSCLVLVAELVVGRAEQEEDLRKLILELATQEDKRSRSFVLRYKKAFCPLLLPHAGTLLNTVVERGRKKMFLRLSQLLLRLGKEQGQESSTATILLSSTVLHWPQLEEEEGSWMLELARHLSLLGELIHSEAAPLLFWWCRLLGRADLRLKVKHRLLSLLAPMAKLATSLEQEEELRSSLLLMASQHFPARSQELVEGSLQLAEYQGVFRLVLRALEMTAAPSLLHLLLSVACREEEHVLEQELQQSLLSTLSLASPAAQALLLQEPWAVLTSHQYSASVKLAATSRVLLPCLLAASVPSLLTFYLAKLEYLLRGASALPRGGEEARITTLTERTFCISLLSALYSRLDRTLVHGHSELTKRASDLLLSLGLERQVSK